MMEGDDLVEPQVPGRANPTPITDIQNQDESLHLLQELRIQLNTLENTNKHHIRKADALPLLKRCIAVIEKAIGSSQLDYQQPPILVPTRNSHTLPDPNPRSEKYTQGYSESPRLNTIYLTQRTLRRQKQRLHRQGSGIHESERFTIIMQNERTSQKRKDELQGLFDRVDAEKPRPTRERVAVLQEAANKPRMPMVPEVHKTQKPREVVTRTEVVPMLPCKGYGLPRGNLFIAGRLGSAETDSQLERIEQMQREEELRRREVRRGIALGLRDAAKAREDKRTDKSED